MPRKVPEYVVGRRLFARVYVSCDTVILATVTVSQVKGTPMLPMTIK